MQPNLRQHGVRLQEFPMKSNTFLIRTLALSSLAAVAVACGNGSSNPRASVEPQKQSDKIQLEQGKVDGKIDSKETPKEDEGKQGQDGKLPEKDDGKVSPLPKEDKTDGIIVLPYPGQNGQGQHGKGKGEFVFPTLPGQSPSQHYQQVLAGQWQYQGENCLPKQTQDLDTDVVQGFGQWHQSVGQLQVQNGQTLPKQNVLIVEQNTVQVQYPNYPQIPSQNGFVELQDSVLYPEQQQGKSKIKLPGQGQWQDSLVTQDDLQTPTFYVTQENKGCIDSGKSVQKYQK
jgi:hypothetical protein